MAKQKQKKASQKKETIIFNWIYNPAKNIKTVIYGAIAVISLLLAFWYVSSAATANSGNGFPLDDPWIHLTFAKNLVEYHSFSYFRNEMATAGSTSPVYTALLAVGFLVTSNEMVLSYVLGILFLVLSAVAFYKLSSAEFGKETVFAVLVSAVFVADKWMNFISVSGMETTMFIFILIGCAWFYRMRRPVLFAVFLSLVLWGRPDGVAFIGALAVDYFLVYYFSKDDKELKLFSRSDFMKIGIVAVVLLGLYFAMNLSLSGSLLPNTYTAKLEYYKPEFRSREEFLKKEVWGYFTSGAYALVMFGFIVSVISGFISFFRKKYNNSYLYIIFILALVFIYWYKLPYAHRFGRYLMPAIPFMVLLAGMGFRDASKYIAGFLKSQQAYKTVSVILFGVTIALAVKNYAENKQNYISECKYISDRQVAAAKWINKNTKEDDIIATHDVGAIGYYSGRKIVDVAGLVTPGLITKISDIDYVNYMTDFLNKSGVKYVAFLREWYRVVNQNPLFSTINLSPVETMEVFEYIPGKTHILPKIVNSMIMDAGGRLNQRNPQQIQYAMQVLNRSLQYDQNSSLTYFYLAFGSSLLNDNAGAERYLIKAVELFPDYTDALLQLAVLYGATGRRDDAVKYYERYLALKPDDTKIKEQYEQMLKK